MGQQQSIAFKEIVSQVVDWICVERCEAQWLL